MRDLRMEDKMKNLELQPGETVFQWIRRMQEASAEMQRSAELQSMLRKWYMRIQQEKLKANPQWINLEIE